MSEAQFADGFDRPESVAFGLGAPQLLTVAVGTLLAYLLQQSSAPPGLRYGLMALIAMTVAVLAWGRLLGRPLLSWAWLAVRYVAAPRSGGETPMAPDDTRPDDVHTPADESEGSREPDAGTAEPVSAPAVKKGPPEPPWARWLREGRLDPTDHGDESEAKSVTPPSAAEPASSTPGSSHSRLVEVERPPIVLLPEPPSTTSMNTTATTLPDLDATDEDALHSTVIPLTPALRVADGGATMATATTEATLGAPFDPSTTPVFVGATRRIAFFGLAGGAGRTTLATEVACFLASRGLHRPTPDADSLPLRVALLDLDLRSANVAIRLGIPQPTLLDYLVAADDDPSLVGRYMVVHSSGLRALLGPPKPLGAASSLEPARVAEIVHQLEREGTHFIICDVAADLGAVTTWVLSAVHDIYVVIRPTASGIQDAYRTTEALRRLGLGHKLRYVVNRARGHVDMDEVMGDLRGRVVATIPDDPRVEQAENTHRQVCLVGAGPAAAAIASLAAQIYPSLGTRRRSRFGLFGRRRVG